MVMVVVLVIVAVMVVTSRPRPREPFQQRSTFPDVVGLRLRLVKGPSGLTDAAKMSSPDLVVAVRPNGTLMERIVIPYAGRPVGVIVRKFQGMYGPSHVVTSEQDRKDPNKVVVIHDIHTKKTKNVHVPTRWSVPPDFLDVPLGTAIISSASSKASSKGPVLQLDVGASGLVATATLTRQGR